MFPEVDEKDAPEGYKAVKAKYLCGKCKFQKKNCEDMPELNCTPDLRKDKQLVIFVRDGV